MKKIFAWLFLLCFISSCEKDFVVKEQSTSKGMVINCLFTDAWQIAAYITVSYTSPGTNNIQVVSDANMELYEDGVFKEVLTYIPSDTLGTFGQYQSQLIPQKGKKYLIKATHPLYGVATAEDVVPLPAEIISHQLLQYPDTINKLRDAIVTFRFRDDGTQENFYRLNVWFDATYPIITSNGDTIQQDYSNGLRPYLITTLSDTVRDNGWYVLFSDKGMNGNEKEVQVKFRNAELAEYYSSMNLYVELYTVSKTHFEYQRTLELYQNSGNIADPVHVYSNVQNGYGIFAASDFQRMQFVVK